MAKARRGRGEGAVFYDTAMQLWTARIVVGDPPRRLKLRARDKAVLLAKVRRAQSDPDLAHGQRVPPAAGMTTGEWLDFWASSVLPGTVADSTLRNYRETVRWHIAPHVGDVKLAALRPEHVDAMVHALAADGKATNTCRLARTILRRALTVAERYGHVPRNVAALTDPPKGSAYRVDPLTPAEAEAVLKAAEGDRLEALAVVVLNLGLRQAEVLDLTWDDVDLAGGQLRVRGTKSQASDRVVPLSVSVAESLRRHQHAQHVERMAATYWHDPALVFPTSIGSRYDKRAITRWWHGLTERAGVGRRRFHASRHTAATLMLNAGVPLEVVSRILGHASLSITSDVYAKPGSAMLRDAADAMEGVLGTLRLSKPSD